MGKLIRIAVLVLFMTVTSLAPAFAMGGRGWEGGRGGHSWGGDRGRGCGTPEIDPGVASSAIALLSCGVLIMTDRYRSKRKRS
jgi:hypothetical protein